LLRHKITQSRTAAVAARGAGQPDVSAIRQRRHERVRRDLGQSWYRAVPAAAERVWQALRFGDLYRSSKEFDLMGRAMSFAALAMLTLVPLLIVIAAASAAPHQGLAVWVVYGMGLTGASARAVVQLFSAPARVLGTTSVFSGLLLAAFGVTFAGSVQGGFERVWGLPAGPWHKIWRQVVWLIALLAYIYAAATTGMVTVHGRVDTASRVAVAVVLGVVFFWWGLRFLVGGRVNYLAAIPGAVITVAFLAGLRVFSALVFEPLIAGNAVTYGPLGTVLIVQSWLIGVGWIIYGGQLFGRWIQDAWLRASPDGRLSHGEQADSRKGGSEGAEQAPAGQRSPPG
jgi:membrane protein